MSARDSRPLADMVETVERRMKDLMSVAARTSGSPTKRGGPQTSPVRSFHDFAREALSSPSPGRASSTQSFGRGTPRAMHDHESGSALPTQRTLICELGRATAAFERWDEDHQQILAHERELSAVHRRLHQLEHEMLAERVRAKQCNEQLDRLWKDGLWSREGNGSAGGPMACGALDAPTFGVPSPAAPRSQMGPPLPAFSFGPARMVPVVQRSRSLSPLPSFGGQAVRRASSPALCRSLPGAAFLPRSVSLAPGSVVSLVPVQPAPPPGPSPLAANSVAALGAVPVGRLLCGAAQRPRSSPPPLLPRGPRLPEVAVVGPPQQLLPPPRAFRGVYAAFGPPMLPTSAHRLACAPPEFFGGCDRTPTTAASATSLGATASPAVPAPWAVPRMVPVWAAPTSARAAPQLSARGLRRPPPQLWRPSPPASPQALVRSVR